MSPHPAELARMRAEVAALSDAVSARFNALLTRHRDGGRQLPPRLAVATAEIRRVHGDVGRFLAAPQTDATADARVMMQLIDVQRHTLALLAEMERAEQAALDAAPTPQPSRVVPPADVPRTAPPLMPWQMPDVGASPAAQQQAAQPRPAPAQQQPQAPAGQWQAPPMAPPQAPRPLPPMQTEAQQRRPVTGPPPSTPFDARARHDVPRTAPPTHIPPQHTPPTHWPSQAPAQSLPHGLQGGPPSRQQQHPSPGQHLPTGQPLPPTRPVPQQPVHQQPMSQSPTGHQGTPRPPHPMAGPAPIGAPNLGPAPQMGFPAGGVMPAAPRQLAPTAPPPSAPAFPGQQAPSAIPTQPEAGFDPARQGYANLVRLDAHDEDAADAHPAPPARRRVSWRTGVLAGTALVVVLAMAAAYFAGPKLGRVVALVRGAPTAKVTNIKPADPARAPGTIRAVVKSDPGVTAPSNAATYIPVLATFSDYSAAREAFVTLKQRYAAVLGSTAPDIETVTVPDGGTWHRLGVLPALPREQAQALCEQLRAAGHQGCWIRPQG